MANESERVFPGVPDIYDRARSRPTWSGRLFREDKLSQGAELNEALTIEGRKRRHVGDLTARDGDRIEGSDILIDVDAAQVTLSAGRIYLRGDVQSVGMKIMNGVPMSGDVTIGVRITTTTIDHEDDAILLGLHEGSESFGEEGGIVQIDTVSWGWATSEASDGGTGDLYPVYVLRNGQVIDQQIPSYLSNIVEQIAVYDYEAHENYIADGCRVTALGKVGNDQNFSIAEGSANILGFKRRRFQSFRHVETEDPDLATVDSEPHSFEDGGTGTAVIETSRSPIATVQSAIVTKEITESVSRGSGDTDILGNTGVSDIVEITQGGTTYVEGADYVRLGDSVDWSPGGNAPATGTSYSVTYRYLDAVEPDAIGTGSVTLSGGVTGTPVFLGYTYKLPRIDRICLNRAGEVVYLKGVSVPSQPLPPRPPVTLLSLCEVRNDWIGVPVILNNGTRSISFAEQQRYNQATIDNQNLLGLERLRREIDSREPVAKKGIFVDPFRDDSLRDAGEDQTAAVFLGTMQIAIDPTFYPVTLAAPVTLDYTTEVVVRQDLQTGCMEINPYDNFTPPPAKMTLDPPVDFWRRSITEWTSSATRTFGSGSRRTVSTTTQRVSVEEEEAAFLRPINVDYTIEGFGAGEYLEALYFDGVDLSPAAETIQADANGTLTGSFTIPDDVATGTKTVEAYGASGVSEAFAEFTGEGTITIETLRRVTTIRRSDPGGNRRGADAVQSGGFRADPLAQTFRFSLDGHVAGIDVQFCALGDRANPVICELVATDDGIPTTDVIAQTEVDLSAIVTGQWVPFRFPVPVFLSADREVAFVFKTDDAQHALKIARRGDFDELRQAFVGAQPYTTGVLLSSSNASTWTPHQDEDLTMRIHAPVFAPEQKIVDIGSVSVSDVSDIIINAGVDLPTSATRILFDVELDDGRVFTTEQGQVIELDAYYTGAVAVRAVLTGTAGVSPILYPFVEIITGEMRASGTYVSRAYPMGVDTRIFAYLKSLLPTGSTMTVDVDAADDNWTPLTQIAAEPIENGWVEREFEIDPHTATTGRIRLTLTGTPSARPALSDLRTGAI